MPNPNFDDVLTTTLNKHKKTISDNVSSKNALYAWIKKKNKIEKGAGGAKIVEPLSYNGNGSYRRYAGYDALDTAAYQVLTAAEYAWKGVSMTVRANGQEIRNNAGAEGIIKIVKAKVSNAIDTAANNFSDDLYSNGALSNQIGGLGSIIQATGLGTVGGIDSSLAANAFWRNKVLELAGTNAWNSTNILGYMKDLHMQLTRGNEKPDCIVATNDIFRAVWDSVQGSRMYIDEEQAKVGFSNIMFEGAIVFHDTNTNFAATGEKAYFLNTKYLGITVHKEADWAVGEKRVPTNEDSILIPILWQGNMTCSNRSMQGLLLDAA